jgi:hypothetical protein
MFQTDERLMATDSGLSRFAILNISAERCACRPGVRRFEWISFRRLGVRHRIKQSTQNPIHRRHAVA